MKSINSFSISGRLTRDAELKHVASGFAVCSFSIAYNRSQKKGDAWEDKPCFIDCVIYGKHGDVISKFLLKGKLVFISGELDHQHWNDSDGKAHNKHIVIVENIVIESGGKKKSPAPAVIEDDDINDKPF